jgi:hypothetical protein
MKSEHEAMTREHEKLTAIVAQIRALAGAAR